MNRDIRKLTDGAMMVAIIGMVLLLDRQLAGMLTGSVLFLYPLPMVFYASKYGVKSSLPVLAAMVLLAFMLGTPQTLFFVAVEALIGVVYGGGVHSKTESRRLLLRTMFMGACVELIAMVVIASFFGYNLEAEVAEVGAVMEDVSANFGTSFPATFRTENGLRTIFIFSIVLLGSMEGAITHLVSRMMMKRMRIELPPSRPLKEYYPPKWTGYLAIAAMLGYVYTSYTPLENTVLQTAVQALGMTGLVYLLVFGVIGAIVVLPSVVRRMGRWAVLIFLVLLFVSGLIIALFGFLYITTDLHQRAVKGGTNAE